MLDSESDARRWVLAPTRSELPREALPLTLWIGGLDEGARSAGAMRSRARVWWLALLAAVAAFHARPVQAQPPAAPVVVVSVPSAPRCGGGGMVAVVLAVRLEADVVGVGARGDTIDVAVMCPMTPSRPSRLPGATRPPGYRGIWPGDRVCLTFSPIDTLPHYDGLFGEPGHPPRFYVTRVPDDRCSALDGR